MDIALINPPSAPGTTANREGAGGLGAESPGVDGFVYPPQTLAYVAAGLREAGHMVRLLDAVATRLTIAEALDRLRSLPVPDQTVEPLAGEPAADDQPDVEETTSLPPLVPEAEKRPQAVGVLVSVATVVADLEFVNQLAQMWPETPIFLFGDSLQHMWWWALEDELAQLAILTDAPFRAARVVEALAGDSTGSLEGLDGAAYWRDGEIVRRTSMAHGDLDRLPRPAWDLLPHERYPFLTLYASRGCHHACVYCPYIAAQGTYRPRSPQLVADEARWLSRTFGPTRLVFRDPAFAADRQHAVDVCQALRKARLRVGWECESRPEHFDVDLLYRMRRAGCQTVKLGLETVDDSLLWSLNRLLPGWTASRYRAHVAELVARCRQLRMSCRVFVMTGLSGETREGLEATLAFLRAVEPPAVSVKRYRPYPGTGLGAEASAVVGYPPLPERELLWLEQEMRATAEPLPPRRRPLWRRLFRR